MKQFYVILLSMFLCVIGKAQVSKSIELSTAGTLTALLTEEEKSTITELIVTGNIDAQDIKCMRNEISHLSVLDLKEANILEYTGSNGPASGTVTYPANEMPTYSFYNNVSDVAKTSLIRIIFPESMNSVGIRACYMCSSLIEIKFSNNLKNIKNGAFGYCKNIEVLSLPNSLEEIGGGSFSRLEKITSLEIPNSVNTIGSAAFSGAYKVQTITIGNSISELPIQSFAFCWQLTTIYITNPVPPTLGSDVFKGSNLSEIFVPAESVNTYKLSLGWGDGYYDIISAIETSNTYDILINYNIGGTVKQDGVVINSGSVINVELEATKTFTIEPISGYEISALTFCGEDVLSLLIDNHFTTDVITVDAELNVTFTKIQYELTIKSAENGSVILFCEYNDSPSLQIIPEVGWLLNSVYYNEVDVTNDVIDGVYSVPTIIENGTLNISFVIDESTLASQLKSADNIKVYNSSYGVVVEGVSNGENVELYNINGVLLENQISKGSNLLFSASKNVIYLIRTSNKAFKIMH